jgi:hypothetical protein
MKLDLAKLKCWLRPGYSGLLQWCIGDEQTSSIGFQVLGFDVITSMRLYYTVTLRSKGKFHCDYQVSFTYTSLPWGGNRYWFICPLRGCHNRVRILYIPPGEKNFGCRKCYDLTYQSCQEQHFGTGLYKMLAASLQNTQPGIHWRLVREYIMGSRISKKNKKFWKFYNRFMNNNGN